MAKIESTVCDITKQVCDSAYTLRFSDADGQEYQVDMSQDGLRQFVGACFAHSPVHIMHDVFTDLIGPEWRKTTALK